MALKEPSVLAALNSIIGIDLKQTITSVQKSVLNEQTSFGLELFKQHSQSFRALQELLTAVSISSSSEEKANEERSAIEGFITDVCLPFLYAFAPTYDGRAELSAALLKVCDMILVCLRQSSLDTVVKIMDICLQSLIAFQQDAKCGRNSGSSSERTLDIVCALELLCITLEIPRLPENNQNNSLYQSIFTAALSVVPHLDEKTANRLMSFVIIKLIQQQSDNKDSYLQEVWNTIESDVVKYGYKLSPYNQQQHLTTLTSMANLFFPLTDSQAQLDVRKHAAFWELVQLGLYNCNPAVRKRSLYLLKRIIDTCEKSDKDFYSVAGTNGTAESGVPIFWWSKQKQNDLSKMWEDFLLLLESLDEKQVKKKSENK
jgi:hypothetical protein